MQGSDNAAARVSYEQSLAIRREIEAIRITASLSNLGLRGLVKGDYAAAESAARRLTIGPEVRPLRIAASLNNLGLVAYSQGDYATARCRPLTISQESETRRGWPLRLAFWVSWPPPKSDYASASACQAQSLTIESEIGNRPGIIGSLEAFGRLAFIATGAGAYPRKKQPGEHHCPPEPGLLRAVRLWGAAQALREQIGTHMDRTEQEGEAGYSGGARKSGRGGLDNGLGGGARDDTGANRLCALDWFLKS